MAVYCKDKCLYLKNTSGATSGYDLDRSNSNNGICKTCRTCGYFIITDILRCMCCGHKFALKNRKQKKFKPNVMDKNTLVMDDDGGGTTAAADYENKINSLIDLSYTQ